MRYSNYDASDEYGYALPLAAPATIWSSSSVVISAKLSISKNPDRSPIHAAAFCAACIGRRQTMISSMMSSNPRMLDEDTSVMSASR